MARTVSEWKGTGGNSVKVIDRGWEDIKENLVELAGGLTVSVGVQGRKGEGQHAGSANTNAEIGAYHEFGMGNTPQRSHWRSTFDENQSKYQKALDKLATKVFEPGEGNIEGELLLLGEVFKTDVVRKIHSGIPPDVSEESLIRKKGEPTPLIDTGQYVDSFGVVVKNRSEVEE